MNGFILIFPFLFVRFVYMSALNKQAIQRAGHFAPMVGKEQIAYYLYQISNIIIFLYLIFTKIRVEFSWIFFIGSILYLLGLALCAITVQNFSTHDEGLHTGGIYGISRNPMYVSYFIFFIGCCFLTQSILLGFIVIVFQISSHWIILAEERWCEGCYKKSYTEYKKSVRRYL